MGYVMHQLYGSVFIHQRNFPAALQAIHEMTICQEHLAWIDRNAVAAAADLTGALSAWRWSVIDEDGNGNITALEFSGEKWGDDEDLFAALAPYVRAGGEIRMVGEDGELWRWIFDSATVKREYGRGVFSPEYGPLGEFHTVLAQRPGS